MDEAKPFGWPAWAVAAAIILAIAGPISLGRIWPNGAFFAGLIPTTFLVVLFSATPSEFRDNPNVAHDMRARVPFRTSSGWGQARMRAFLAAGVLLLLAILSDWWAIRFD